MVEDFFSGLLEGLVEGVVEFVGEILGGLLEGVADWFSGGGSPRHEGKPAEGHKFPPGRLDR